MAAGAILLAGALGLVVLNREWSGLCAGAAGLLVSVLAYRNRPLRPTGPFLGLTLMGAYRPWRLRGDSEAIDPLVVIGLFAGLGGLLVGGLLANILGTPRPGDEPG